VERVSSCKLFLRKKNGVLTSMFLVFMKEIVLLLKRVAYLHG
jgi:hypothetical protein